MCLSVSDRFVCLQSEFLAFGTTLKPTYRSLEYCEGIIITVFIGKRVLIEIKLKKSEMIK